MRFSPEALLLPAANSESPGSSVGPNEIWMSVFGGFVWRRDKNDVDPGGVDREGERGKGEGQERTKRVHDRF